ncbi:hypothetical protein [Actinoalloteichus hymeniacidonis]|nr:hypothetical protein [Actinoalloteichus hymeniacidonis]MBB5910360.1 hypothetical protein [Actinoalloteichus hymeniacidonis]
MAAEWYGTTSPHAHRAQACLRGVEAELEAAQAKLVRAAELIQCYVVRL